MLNRHRSWKRYVNGFRCVHRGRLDNKRVGRINTRFHGQAAALRSMRRKSRPFCTPTFPGPSASRKPGLRKQFTSSCSEKAIY